MDHLKRCAPSALAGCRQTRHGSRRRTGLQGAYLIVFPRVPTLDPWPSRSGRWACGTRTVFTPMSPVGSIPSPPAPPKPVGPDHPSCGVPSESFHLWSLLVGTGEVGEETSAVQLAWVGSTARVQPLLGLSSCSQANFARRSPNLPLVTLSGASEGGRRGRFSLPRAATYTNTSAECFAPARPTPPTKRTSEIYPLRTDLFQKALWMVLQAVDLRPLLSETFAGAKSLDGLGRESSGNVEIGRIKNLGTQPAP